jgi:hypothetical protein
MGQFNDGSLLDKHLGNVHMYNFLEFTPSSDCCTSGPGGDGGPTGNDWLGKWWRIEVIFINRAGPGFDAKVYMRNITDDEPEIKVIDLQAAGFPPWTSSLTPPQRMDAMLVNNFRHACAGWIGISHYMMAGWDTNAGQRIGAAEEVEGEPGGDTTDPTISITAPTSSPTYLTATDPITTIAGPAGDNTGVTSITWTNAATSGSGSGTGCNGETSCNWSIATIDLNEGANPITVTAHDAAENTGEAIITVTLDTMPPSRSNGAPTGTLSAGTTQTNISLDTTEAATCKWDTTPSTAYASMANTFTTTGSTSHSTTVTGLSDGNSYTYYVRCADGLGNANPDDFSIAFSVDSAPGLTFPGAPTSLSSSSGGTPTFPGAPTALSSASGGTPTMPGTPTALSSSSGGTPTFPGQPTGISSP